MMAPSPQQLRVFEFMRVSTEQQDLERQEFDLADNRARYNLNPIRKLGLKVSGTEVGTKEEWQKMIAAMESPDYDAISLSALDRLFRPGDFACMMALQVLADHKKLIISAKHGEGMIEPWDRKGRQICLRAITRAGDELNDLTDRIAGGRRKLHAQNKPMNTTPCYGILYRDKYNRDADGKAQYFYEDMTPATDELSKRDVVVMIFDWRYRHGWRVGSIVIELNRRRILSSGYKGKGGVWVPPGPWTRATVLQLLKNRKYIGEHWEGGKRVNCACPVFVDREVFEAVQKLNVAKKPGRPPVKHLLCGYLECGPCTHKYCSHSGSRRRTSYRCGRLNRQRQFLCTVNHQVPCHILDEVVFKAIWRHLTDAALFLRNVRAYYDSLPGKSEVIAMEKELATLAAKVSRLEDQIDQGAGDHQKAIARILGYQTRMGELTTALKSAGSVVTLPDEHVMRAALAEVVNPDDEPESFEERRPVLESLANLKMVYDKGHVEITGSVPVASCAHKCRGRFTDPSNSVQYIPFKIKARVA